MTPAVPTLSTRSLLLFVMGVTLPERPFLASKRLVAVMSDLGYETGATRVTLARLCTTGQIERLRSGRETAYRLTPLQAETNSTVTQRVSLFGVHTEWDGQWTIVSFSIPEGARGLRVALKSRLGFMGFGRLREGTWCATRNCDDELKALTQSLELDHWIDIFVGWPSPLEDVDDVIARCWDLSTLAAGYRSFVARFEHLRSAAACRSLSDHDAIAWWIRLTHDYRTLVFQDPELPEELLDREARAHRRAAVSTFATVEDRLRPRSTRILLDGLGQSVAAG